MTPQEAIQRIKNHNEHHSQKERFAIHITEALNMAVEALTKQIPMKCTGGIDKKEYIDGYCPNCLTRQAIGSLDWKRTFNRYCRDCGQALDWSDTE